MALAAMTVKDAVHTELSLDAEHQERILIRTNRLKTLLARKPDPVLLAVKLMPVGQDGLVRVRTAAVHVMVRMRSH